MGVKYINPLKYPLVHELVIVIADLYLPDEGALDGVVLPGLERIARFGTHAALPDGWRAWLARSLGRQDLAVLPPATVAAFCAGDVCAGSVWLATPVHLGAGLTSVHMDNRGLLKLPMATLATLAKDFHKVFHGSGFALEPLASGGFLLLGRAPLKARALEPARCVGASMAANLPGAPTLRRLGAEVEIWLHEHPVNLERTGRGQLPITGLWMWGGGTAQRRAATSVTHVGAATERAYGRDPYLDGLWCASGASTQGLPATLEDALQAPVNRVAMVVELAEFLDADRATSVAAALGELDARWLRPAERLVARGAVAELSVLANDRCLSLRRRDALKRWRRQCRGLQGLQ
jgi:hypothetical protein